MAHTPKWMPCGPSYDHGRQAEVIEQEGFGRIGQWVSFTGEALEQRERILRAVNNNDRLIEALEECVTENGAFAFASEDFYRAKQRLMAISNIARAALAAARGEE